MRWRTANNNRRKAEREWLRAGRYRYLWPNLRENWKAWADSCSDAPTIAAVFPMPSPPLFDIARLVADVQREMRITGITDCNAMTLQNTSSVTP